jgi:hypothetical protein
MNHFYTEKLSFFRNSRFVFQELGNKEVKNVVETGNKNPEGEPIRGNENPDTLALQEARKGKGAVEDGKNTLLALQGEKGREQELLKVEQDSAAALIQFSDDMPNSPEIREAIAAKSAKENPDEFVANPRFFENTKGYSKYLETAVTNPNASPACLLAFANVYKNQPYANAVIAKAVDNLKDTDPKALRWLKGNPKYADVVAKAEEKNSRMSPQYT